MSRYNPYYYLLFVLLIFGAFAAMAQNDYGMQVLGFAALAFGVIFLLQLAFALRRQRVAWMQVAELGSLVVLSVILFMRVFYLRFPFVEVLFGVAGITLVAGYLVKLAGSWRALKSKSKAMGGLLMLFFGSLVFYSVSMTVVPFAAALARPAGVSGFVLMVLFLALALVKQDMLIDGERLSAFRYVARLKDRSAVLATLFLLFTAYMGLTHAGVLPKMYVDQFPQAYYDLVNRAESGTESPGTAKFQHAEFKRQYDLFIERHAAPGN